MIIHWHDASANVRSLLGDYFEYSQITNEFTQKEISKYKQSIIQRYKKLTTRRNTELNSKWVARHYLAVKMILAQLVDRLGMERYVPLPALYSLQKCEREPDYCLEIKPLLALPRNFNEVLKLAG